MNAYMTRHFMLACCVALALAACGPMGYVYQDGSRVSRKKFLADTQVYQPYQDQNTLEGYREFLKKYPGNVFAMQAREKMHRLEFKPYEKQDTIEGYLEFKMLYPNNPNVDKANWHIEQVEIRRYDNIDTVAGYRTFLEKYPRSIFANSAHERLQELAVREQDREISKRYGFDLLKYRYEIRKACATQSPLWDFQVFAHVREQNGRALFVTRLLYGTLPDLQDDSNRAQLKKEVVSRLLEIIAAQGSSAARLPQPLFEICHAPYGLNENAQLVLSYDVQSNGLQQLIAGRSQAHELLTAFPAVPAAVSPVASELSTAGHVEQETQPYMYAPSAPQPVVSAPVMAMPPSDPAGIMRCVANSNSFTDALLSRRWETTFSDSSTKAISVIEKHRRYDTQKDIRSATVLRYLETRLTRSDTRRSATAILHQRSLKAEDRYWYIMQKGDAGITTHIDVYRPDAENAFYLEQYVDCAPESETHELLARVTQDNRPVALIKSTPLNAKPYYAWRKSTIDLERLVPLQIEYYDAQGMLQKEVTFSWQLSFGVWYWDTAMFRNLADGSTTRITTTDMRINLDLPERDFQPGALHLFGK